MAEPSYLKAARGRCRRRREPAPSCRGETLPSGSTRLCRPASNRRPRRGLGGRGRRWRKRPRSSSVPSDLFKDDDIQGKKPRRGIKELLPLASEQTPRNPSSVRHLNKGRTPKVSLPTQTLLLPVSSRIKAKTPSRRDAIFTAPKRSYRWSRISPSTSVWWSNPNCFLSWNNEHRRCQRIPSNWGRTSMLQRTATPTNGNPRGRPPPHRPGLTVRWL